jgi:N-acyl-D-aspartate/D-glutamate deacylase
MFKFLGRVLGLKSPDPLVPVDEKGDILSDAQLLRAHFSVSEQAEEAFSRFVILITEHLGTEESQRLTSLAVSRLRSGDSPHDAIVGSILADEGQRRGKWLLLQVDWKAADEVEWQANELLAVAGVAKAWHVQGADSMTVPKVLLAFSSWVRQRGRHLLHLDLEDDAYCALLVPSGKSDEIISAAEEIGLKLQGADQFAGDNARDC